MLKTILNKFRFPEVKRKHTYTSFSQEGEDIILRKLLKDKKKGFYIDVNDFDSNYSNTYYFYENGWTGLNIYCQPMENSQAPVRHRDINIYKTIGRQPELRTVYSNGNSKNNASDVSFKSESVNYDLLQVDKKIEITTLNLIFKSYLPRDNKGTINMFNIDLLNICSPLNELNIILSNNWKIYRPRVIAVADFENLDKFNPDSSIFQFLKSHDYIFHAKTSGTLIFKERNYSFT